MRQQVTAFIVAAATFGVVNGAIVGVGLAVARPSDGAAVFALAKPDLRAEVRVPRVVVKAPS